MRLSEEEHSQLISVKETMHGRHADDVAHGAVISKLCERFEKQQALISDE